MTKSEQKRPAESGSNTAYLFYESPVGAIVICATDLGLKAVLFDDMGVVDAITDAATKVERGKHPVIDLTLQQLDEYFCGERTQFDLPLAMSGTPFQKQVWQALCDIPFGETCYYSQLADAISRPKAVRAVGAANGQNLLGIVVPCHRVIGKDGSLTGYAGGLNRKQWLLAHERHLAEKQQRTALP